MLLDLPPEILLSVLKHLSISDISSCICTSKILKGLIDQHESAVYRQAAAHPSLQLIPHDQILFSEIPTLGFLSKRYIGNSSNWKDLCRRAHEMRSCWLGKGPSRIRNYRRGYLQYPNVHRIKVDEKRGFFITTHGQHNLAGQGRLVVSDINDGTAIWSLDSRHVRRHAHCEYGEGYLIFDRSMDAKEVWRLVSVNPELPDPEEYEVVPEALPDEFQMKQTHPYLSGGRLKFVPHALLRPPGNLSTRAFRFVYPTLLVAASNCLLLWDVRTGRLIERIDDIQNQMPSNPGLASGQPPPAGWNSGVLGRICYVEVNEKYAFICGETAFKIFRRRGLQTEKGKPEVSQRTANCVLAITKSQLRRRGKWHMRLGYVEQEDLPVGFGDWGAKKGYPETEEDPDETELEDDPMFHVWETDGMDDTEEENEFEEVIELVPNPHGRNIVPAGSDDHLYPRISMWKSSGKAVVSHKTELTVTSSSFPVHDHLSEYCVAVHVSPCGQHLAILAQVSRLLIIPYFERALDGPVKDYHDIMIDLQLGAPLQSIYLAYEDGRIGVVTQLGVFIVHPTFPPPDDFQTPPTLKVHRIPLLNDPQILFYVNCLQMSSTALWINWEVEPTRPGLFTTIPKAMQDLEEDEQSFEESFDTVVPFQAIRWPDNSVVVSVDFGIEN